jgi:hypothetical protein
MGDQAGGWPGNVVVSFPDWKAVLIQEGFSWKIRNEYRRAILGFLHLCKVRKAAASVGLAREYLGGLPVHEVRGAREALRWWFITGRGMEKRGGDWPAEPPRGEGAVEKPKGVKLGWLRFLGQWKRDDLFIVVGLRTLPG